MESIIKKHQRKKLAKRQLNLYIESLNPQSFKDKVHAFFRRIWEHKFFYLILIPAIVLLIIFAYKPMYGIVLAFKRYSPRKGIMGSKWVGFNNFRELFAIDDFYNAFKNTIIINVLKLIFGFPASIVLAIMLNSLHNKIFKNVLQTMVYLPHFVSWVVVSGLIMALFNERSGSLYKFFSLFGDVNVFGSGPQAIALIIISDIWKEVGWGAIIYLAALSGISGDLYEAAELDGANSIHQFFHVTLPQLMPTISIMLILRVGGIIGGGFDQIYSLFNGNSIVKPYVDVLDTFVYRYGIGNGQFSIATAIGLFENLINIVLLFSANQIVSLINKE